MSWRSELEKITLGVLRHCFVKDDGSPASLVRGEYYGDPNEPSIGGAKDYLEDIVLSMLKRCFREAHYQGALSAIASLPEEIGQNFLLDEGVNKHWAEKKWIAYLEKLEQ